MVELLEKKCDASVLEEVANSLQDLMGSTAKFMNFVEKFLPEPPTTRPQAVFQINWAWTSKDGGALKQRVAKIYDLRSKALHQAIPFPSILCSAPFLNGTHAYVECPSGGVTDGSSSWKKSELPMHLHIFAYIVRGAILRWAAQAN
ncbi:hypothetical protein F183_A00020 [Bryobacterales bacterium F-183]|nr:hypothetical protein F183_A00020 [Bryobacterales bacterium F-183]